MLQIWLSILIAMILCGYVPTIHTSDECAYYDENAGEWYMC